VAQRKSALEDLIDLASRLPWYVSLVFAVVSGVVLHALAAALSAPRIETPGALGGVVARGLYGTIAALLQFVVPMCFAVGALAALLKRSRATALFAQARSAPEQSIDGMTWEQFECLVGEAFRRRGYQVTETGGGGSDGGVDLVLVKGSDRFLVQCKQWRTQRVGVATVRELYGVIAARGATGGFVVTSGDFTEESRQFARDCRIELVDGDGLTALIREIERASVNNGTVATGAALPPAIANVSRASNRCPKCGSAMALRTAKRGPHVGHDFLGCTRYPVCRGIRRLDETVGE
jgi:restriction system protein